MRQLIGGVVVLVVSLLAFALFGDPHPEGPFPTPTVVPGPSPAGPIHLP